MLIHTDCPSQCAACYQEEREVTSTIASMAEVTKFVNRIKEHR